MTISLPPFHELNDFQASQVQGGVIEIKELHIRVHVPEKTTSMIDISPSIHMGLKNRSL